jgi:hypothetical protein
MRGYLDYFDSFPHDAGMLTVDVYHDFNFVEFDTVFDMAGVFGHR